MTVFIIDGIEVTTDDVLVMDLQEDGDILNGKNSGRRQDGVDYREPIGTYYNFSITFERRIGCPLEKWDQLFDILSDPNGGHIVSFPHDQGTMTHSAYVSGPSRKLERVRNGRQYWGPITLKFVADEPQRRP